MVGEKNIFTPYINRIGSGVAEPVYCLSRSVGHEKRKNETLLIEEEIVIIVLRGRKQIGI